MDAAKKFQKSCKMKIFHETKLQNSKRTRAVGALKVIKNVHNLTFPAEWFGKFLTISHLHRDFFVLNESAVIAFTHQMKENFILRRNISICTIA